MSKSINNDLENIIKYFKKYCHKISDVHNVSYESFKNVGFFQFEILLRFLGSEYFY